MRKDFSGQLRLDCQAIEQLQLNLDCRDEIVPILAALKHVFGQVDLRNQIMRLVALDINEVTRNDIGREGLNYWQIVVLGVVRLGCNLDYDKLQDLCENHRALRCLLGSGDWDDTSFSARRLGDTLALLNPTTIENINQLIVSHGQDLHGDARAQVRGDSFVIETNIHYPTESSLIWDGVQKIISRCVELAALLGEAGWRQAAHLEKKIKQCVRQIDRISASKAPRVKATLNDAYAKLLDRVAKLLDRARTLQTTAQQAKSGDVKITMLSTELTHWLDLTVQVADTAYRRTQLGETVPNDDKLFSLFEPHTQLYRRGKAGEPTQFGRLALIYEDRAGFISHYHLMDRTAADSDVLIEQTQLAQQKHQGGIEEASFDRGFYSTANEKALQEIVAQPCLPPTHPSQYAECLATASVGFHRSRQRHPGVESAIGALQRGNGLKRCRDKTEVGLERYLGLAILGRNLQTLGKLLIARCQPNAAAGKSHRKAG